MAKLIDVAKNRPGGIYYVRGFELFEGETLDVHLKLVEWAGGPAIDCAGWTIALAGISFDPHRPQADVNLSFGTTLDAGGLLKISTVNAFSGVDSNRLEDNLAGSAATYPGGRTGWLFVRAHQGEAAGSQSVYLIRPSQITLRQGPGAPS